MLQPPPLPPIQLLFSPSNLITSNFYFLIFFHLRCTCIEWLLMYPTSSFPIPLFKCLRNTNDSLKQTKKVWLQAQIEKWHCMHMTHLINWTKQVMHKCHLPIDGLSPKLSPQTKTDINIRKALKALRVLVFYYKLM